MAAFLFCLLSLAEAYPKFGPFELTSWTQPQLAQNSTRYQDFLRFLAVGDIGGVSFSPYTTQAQVSNAKVMDVVSRRIDSQMIINCGDNFYWNGICNGVEDPRWKTTFEGVYNPYPSLTVPWFSVIGNHDQDAWTPEQQQEYNTTACGEYWEEVNYTLYNGSSGYWQFPAQWYYITYPLPSMDENVTETVTFIMLDTNHLIANCTIANTQYLWLVNLLQSLNDTWIFAAGHHTIYSLGEHGPDPCLTMLVEPLLYQYNVSGYFNGHDHRLQYFLTNNMNGTIDTTSNNIIVNYFGTGAIHGIDAPVNFSDLSPSEYAAYIPAFNANRFLWPLTYTAAELVPNQDTLPRTIPDSGSDRGGFMAVELSSLCVCTQWYDSYNNFLYSNSFPNLRKTDLSNSSYCQDRCKVFIPVSADDDDGDAWYDNAGAVAGVVIAGIVVIFLAIGCILYRRKKLAARKPLDEALLPTEIARDEEPYNTIGTKGTVQTTAYEYDEY